MINQNNPVKLGIWNNELEQRATTILREIKQRLIVKSIPLDNFLYKKCGYKKGSEMPVIDETFSTFSRDEKWGNEVDSHAWFYKKINFEKDFGRCELSVKTDATGWDANNPQFMVYFNGKMVQGLDINHTSVAVKDFGETNVYIYAYTSALNKEPYRFFADVNYVDEETERLYYNLYVPTLTLKLLEQKSEEYQILIKYINETINLLDLRVWHSENYYASVKKANDFIENKFYKGVCHETSAKVACLGHTHIDIAWLWPIRQTYEKAQRSFANVCALMDRFDDYQFMSSQVTLYKAVKEENPELYERIKQLVKEGRWQVEGGSYVEMDCNIVSGESLVRQFLYGKRFFNKEFGVDCKTLWLPDVFGYSAALPQILQKVEMDSFVTQKIGWSETNLFPYDTFIWRGIDGSEVVSHYITAQDYIEHPTGNHNTCTYVAEAEPKIIKGTYNRYHQKDINNEALATIGYGDGGGGTTTFDCEVMKRLDKGVPGLPTAKFRNTNDYLNEVKRKALSNPKTPKWVGELYLEYHRGTYTSQAKNKKYNRKTEYMLTNVENLGVIGEVTGLYSYDKENLYKYWEMALVNQFHDIIPGSSIRDVYDDTDKEYAETFAYGEGEINKALKVLGENVNKKGVLVYNPNPFVYNGAVEFNGARYYVENIPSKGYKVVDLKTCKTKVKATLKGIENKYFKVKFDKNFNVVSVFDKSLNREVLKKGKAIKFRGYEDFTHDFDAWEINRCYTEKAYDVNEVVSADVVFDNDRAGVKVTRKFENSLITDTVYLYDNEKYVGFENDIDWNTEHILLKREFPIDVVTDKATCEIQFGNAERPTHANTTWDAAKFEVCAHKYVDLSETDFGVAVVNESKYGYSLNNNDIGLSLLKGATYPDPNADKGNHKIAYALYTHEGSANASTVANFAYKYNNPAIAVEVQGGGNLPSEYSLVSCDSDNVFVETCKIAEDGNDVIVRMFEAKRVRKTVTVNFGFDVKEVYIANMLEKELEKIEVKNNAVTLNVKPFEIITLKVKR